MRISIRNTYKADKNLDPIIEERDFEDTTTFSCYSSFIKVVWIQKVSNKHLLIDVQMKPEDFKNIYLNPMDKQIISTR